MRWNRASPKDRQSEIRTKISDQQYTDLCEIAEREGVTVYRLARAMIEQCLMIYASAERSQPHTGHPKSTETGDFGKVRGQARPLEAESPTPAG